MPRAPWLTIGLAIALVAGTVTTGLDLGARTGEARAALAHSVAFFEQHPYLEPGPIGRLLGAERIAELRDEYAQGGESPSRFELVQAQDELNRLSRRALAAAEARPDRQLGVLAGSPPEALVTHAFIDVEFGAMAVSLVFLAVAGTMLELAVGSVAFGLACLALIAGSGFGYTLLFPNASEPWIGSSAFVAGLMGVYAVVSFGRFSIPGWALLPAWGLAEYLGTRGLRIGDIAAMDPTPPTLHGASLAGGAVLGVVLLMVGAGQRRARAAAEERELVSNPVLERAMRAREAGQHGQAMTWLAAAWKQDRRNLDLAVAYWDVARQTGDVEQALPAGLVILEQALHNGQTAQALTHWGEIVSLTQRISGDPRTFVRVGELLVEAGQLSRAGVAMEVALANAPSPALALCIVQATSGSHPHLAGAAAEIALRDPKLPPARRVELEALRESGRGAPRVAALEVPDAAPAAEPSGDEVVQDPGALSAEQLGADVPAAEEPAAGDGSGFGEVDGLGEEGGGSIDLDAPRPGGPAGDAAALMPALDLESTSVGEESLAGAGLDAESLALSLSGRSLRRIEAAPRSLDSEGLLLETRKGQRRIAFGSIEALAVGAVEGEGAKPVLVIDLVLNWMALGDEPLRVVRLRSDRMNARALVPEADGPGDALRILLEAIREHGSATPLPDAEAASGRPFARFSSLAAYEERVLGARAG